MNFDSPFDREERSTGGFIMLMLSLKLILLAFFILLTTMAEFDDQRTRDVLESVNKTFVGKVPAVTGTDKPDAATGALQGAKSLKTQLKTLFEQTIPAVKVTESADGRVLRLEMDARELFERGSTALAPGTRAFVRRMSRALTEGKSGKQFYEMQFLHAYPGAAAIGQNSLAVLRGGAFVRRLTAQGLQPKQVSAGLWPVAADSPDLGNVSIAIHLFTSEPSQGAVSNDGEAAQ
jgi:hypothetical protein